MTDENRRCPTCGELVTGSPYDIGSGPELCCSNCETCFGFNGQPLDPADPLRVPQEVIDQMPEWARHKFIPTEER